MKEYGSQEDNKQTKETASEKYWKPTFVMYTRKEYQEYKHLLDDALQFKGNDSYDLYDLFYYLQKYKNTYPNLYNWVFQKDPVIRTLRQSLFGLSVSVPSMIVIGDD